MKSVNDISKGLCKGVGVFGNFGALSSFFWYYIITNNCIAGEVKLGAVATFALRKLSVILNC